LVTEANNKDAELHTAVERINSTCDYESLFSSPDCEESGATYFRSECHDTIFSDKEVARIHSESKREKDSETGLGGP
jgi:hypothetical protein